MRFAPPNPLRIADRATGLNAVSIRSYNERLLLSLLLQNEGITRLEIGEKTGLSAQTISVLLRSLEQEGLVSKGKAQRGRVGPPTIPVALNPEGAFSVGISVGYKNTEVVLIDFVGNARFHSTLSNPQPNQTSNHSKFIETIRSAIKILPKECHGRLAGIGLAIPEANNAIITNEHEAERGYKILQEEIELEIDIPVFVQNDITAAAGGESMFGAAKPLSDYLFFYLGAELHSRLILNHQIYNGNSALSFDVGIKQLEIGIQKVGLPIEPLWQRSTTWPDYGQALKLWEVKLIERLKSSYEALAQFVEIETIILSSYAPQSICENICSKIESEMPNIKAVAGILNPSPKAVGAASLPFSSRFMVE